MPSFPSFQLFRRGAKVAAFQGRPDRAALLAWVAHEAPAFATVEF